MKQEGREEEGEEEKITAKDWILRRALSRRAGGDYEKSLGTEGKRLGGIQDKRDSGVVGGQGE